MTVRWIDLRSDETFLQYYSHLLTLSQTGLVNLVSGRDSETLINYLDQNLIVLKEKLNETNFERILSVIWESSAQSLSDTIQMSIEVTILLMRW